jgi:hypothetical protein
MKFLDRDRTALFPLALIMLSPEELLERFITVVVL